MFLETEVGAKLKGVRIVNHRNVVDELPRGDRAQIVHRFFKVEWIIRHIQNYRRIFTRIWIIETKREPVEAGNKLINYLWRDGPAIVHGEIARRAVGIDEVWKAREFL